MSSSVSQLVFTQDNARPSSSGKVATMNHEIWLVSNLVVLVSSNFVYHRITEYLGSLPPGEKSLNKIVAKDMINVSKFSRDACRKTISAGNDVNKAKEPFYFHTSFSNSLKIQKFSLANKTYLKVLHNLPVMSPYSCEILISRENTPLTG